MAYLPQEREQSWRGFTRHDNRFWFTRFESGGWRELLAGAGVRTAAISGSGVFRDDATDARARAIFFAGDTPEFQVIIPDFGVVQGAFQITSVEYVGNYDGEATYSLSLASAGALTFTAL